jgi:hypothetical protein
MRDAPLLITLSLALTVALDQLWILLAVLFLVVGMFIPPLLLAIADDLEVLGVCCQLLAVIIATPLPLTLRPTAHALLWPINGGLKRILTVRTTAGWDQADSSGS